MSTELTATASPDASRQVTAGVPFASIVIRSASVMITARRSAGVSPARIGLIALSLWTVRLLRKGSAGGPDSSKGS